MNNYKVIKSIEQYNQYCEELEYRMTQEIRSLEDEENIELLIMLIDKWDEESSNSNDMHPVEMLNMLMNMHEINANELSRRTGIDKTVLSKILNYKKGFSKEIIRTLSDYFKINQAAFNKPYAISDSKEKVTKTSKSILSVVKEAPGKYGKKKA